MASTRKTPSAQCFTLIKRFEGICDGDPKTVNLDPYLDPVKIWSIACGHAIRLNGRFLKGAADSALAKSLYPNGLTFAQAEDLLVADVQPFAIYLNGVFPTLTQNEFDALISFVFNEGIGNFESSTLFKLIKAGQKAAAAEQFGRWIYSTDEHGNKIKLAGLVTRRAAERDLFLTV